MKHIIQQYDEPIYKSSSFDFYFGGLRIGVLDIETTGLSPATSKFILGGLFNLQTNTMHQIFAENRGEEKEALKAFYAELSELDMVITYNGKHFDMPFIEKRMRACGIKETCAESVSIAPALPYNLDIYLVVNGHSPIKKLVPNLKQKTVESYMGLWQSRTDEISGAESVELYNRYEKTGSSELEAKILLHNCDDVLQLTRLIKVLGKCDIHKAMYHLGFPVLTDKSCGEFAHTAGSFVVKKVCTEKNSLIITGEQPKPGIEYMGFSFGGWPAESRFDKNNGTFTMKLPVIRNSGLCIIDLDAAGLEREPFEKYPACSSGFLVIEERNEKKYQEINHFIKAFLELFIAGI